MPTYVYRCEQCSNHLEVIQKFSDAPLKVCPKCQGHLHRVIHATGIVFKGSGWYITDSRSSSSATHTAPKETKAESTTTAPAKTETTAPSPAASTPTASSSD
jgi:putative FmdB family regulatory protein